MSRSLSIVLYLLATILVIRAGQVYWQVWKAADSRKALLGHFVDHTRTLTEQEIYEKRFWSDYGDHAEKTFFWYFLGSLSAMGASQWLDGRRRKRKIVVEPIDA